MSSFAHAERLVDAVGPIVVKEVRQGLRARLFSICFALLLLGCFVIALVAAAEVGRREWEAPGPRYLAVFLGALGVVEFFVIPYSAYRAMAKEREDETWVLLALTGLGPRRIVRGKVASALAQAVLYASAIAPFVLFSYYLNGVSLLQLVVALGMAACWSVFLTALAVAAATQAKSRLGRGFMHFVVLGVLLVATAAAVAFGAVIAMKGDNLLDRHGELLVVCSVVCVVALSTAGVLLEGAAAGLSLPSENGAKGPRLALMAQVLVGIVCSVVLSAVFSPTIDGAHATSVISCLFIAGAGFFATSERDGVPRAFASERFLFRPGALRSFVVVLGLLACSTAASVVVYAVANGTPYWAGRSTSAAVYPILAAPLYVALYLSIGVLLGRLTPLKQLAEPVATRVATAALIFIGSVAPPVAAEAFGGRGNDRTLNALNPLVGLGNYLDGRYHQPGAALAVLVALTLLATFLAHQTLSSRDGVRGA